MSEDLTSEDRQTDLIIRPARKGDYPGWRRMWDAYCAFYGTEVPDEVTKTTWGRLLDEEIPFMGAYVATMGELGQPVGFVTWVLHAATWSLGPRCYLEDLYVDEAERKRGIGRALMETVINHARREKAERVYWMTKADNASARSLYDALGREAGFVRYDVDL